MTCNNLDHYNNTWPLGETTTGLQTRQLCREKKKHTHTHTHKVMAITIHKVEAGSQSSNSTENTKTIAKAIKWP